MKTPRLNLEFAPNAKPVSRLGAIMLFASAFLVVAAATPLGLALAHNMRQADLLAAIEARQAQSTLAGSRTVRPDPAQAARTRAARKVAQQLVTPWADLLATLESAPVQSVALLSIEPSINKNNFRLTAEARNEQDMLSYLAALQQDARLYGVLLVSHQVQVQAPGAPIRFQMQAGWGAPQ
jgi:hypothetical protein